MSCTLIETTNLAVNLTPRPIEPSWIIEGNPVAQSCVLSKSADGLASTMVWECSEGRFNWYYDFEETVLILEGRSSSKAIPCRQTATSRATSSSSGTARTPDGMSRAASGSLPSAARPSRPGSALRCWYFSSSRDSGAGRQPPGCEFDGLRLGATGGAGRFHSRLRRSDYLSL